MEQQSKLGEIDFFRHLPDSVSHRILSFLGCRDIARFSTVSTNCRELCLTLPVLAIEFGNASGKELYKFNAFLDSFTSLHNGADVHQFKAEKYGQNRGGDHHIGNWILKATKSNVEKIILGFNKFKTFTLPSGLSNSACLRDLEVRMNPQGWLNLPITSFVGLEKLKLRDVRVSTNFDELISSCKSLKMVHLHAVTCVNTLNIRSLSLEDLILKDMLVGSPDFNIKVSAERLRNLCIVWLNAPQPSQSLKLHAPKLEQFSWGGLASHYSCEGNLESLSNSNISIDFNDKRVALGIIGQIFQSIYRVSSISIRDYSIKEISSPELLPEFCDLHSLTLKCTNSSIEIPSAISLLNLMPHLNSLKIEFKRIFCHPSKKMEKSFSSEYWESQNLKFVHSLNEVDMDISGEHNDIELIKYLLKNAKLLKKIKIRLNTRIFSCAPDEIIKKIRQFQIASSSIVIYFFSYYG